MYEEFGISEEIENLAIEAEENLKAISLKVYCDKYKPAEAIRTSMSDYREQSWLTNIPLYCISNL